MCGGIYNLQKLKTLRLLLRETFIHHSTHLKTTRALMGYSENFGGKWSKFGKISFVTNKKR